MISRSLSESFKNRATARESLAATCESLATAYARFASGLIAALLFLSVAPGVSALEPGEMNVALLGDSNTWLGGEDCSGEQGWSHWFAMETSPKSIRSYARSGATWTHNRATAPDVKQYTEVLDDNNVIYNQVLRLMMDVEEGKTPRPDIVIIAAGTNDAWFADRRPEAFSKSVEEAYARDEQELGYTLPSAFRSLAEGVRYDLYYLRAFLPGARPVVMTPIPSVKISSEMLERVSDLIAGAAERFGAEVIRMDRLSPVNPEKEMVNRRFTTDGTHTSAEGARRHGEIVARAVMEMLPK